MIKYFEQVAWIVALVFLYFIDTSTQSTSLCLFKLIGFDACFGCGIGHAIHHVLHFDLIQSFDEHILGVPATVGIIYRIFSPLITKTIKYGSATNAYDASGNTAG